MKRRKPFSLKRILSSPVTLVIALVLFVVLARAAWAMIDRSRASEERLDQAQAQYAKLAQNQKDLTEEVAELSAPGGAEADLREKYHAVAPGESVAVIMDPSGSGSADSDQSASAAEAVPAAPAESWWHRFLDFFGL